MSAPPVITVSQQFGCCGRRLGALLARELDIPYYDCGSLEPAPGVSPDLYLSAGEDGLGLCSRLFDQPGGPSATTLSDRVYLAERAAVRALAEKGPCVIVSQEANAALQDLPSVFHLFLYADAALRQKRVAEALELWEAEAKRRVRRADRKRRAYLRFYTGARLDDPARYHLCLDVGRLTDQHAAQIVLSALGAAAVHTS